MGGGVPPSGAHRPEEVSDPEPRNSRPCVLTTMLLGGQQLQARVDSVYVYVCACAARACRLCVCASAGQAICRPSQARMRIAGAGPAGRAAARLPQQREAGESGRQREAGESIDRVRFSRVRRFRGKCTRSAPPSSSLSPQIRRSLSEPPNHPSFFLLSHLGARARFGFQ